MCIKCAISDAVNDGDWDEVQRLAKEASGGEHDDELPLPADAVVPAADESEKKSSTASRSSE